MRIGPARLLEGGARPSAREEGAMPDVVIRKEPVVRRIAWRDIAESVTLGLRDLRAHPRYGFSVGLFFALGGVLVVTSVVLLGVPYLAYPLAAGFVLVGPFAALVLYEVSRRRDASEPVDARSVLSVMISRSEVKWMAFVTLFIFLLWMYQVRLLIALFLGIGARFSTFAEFLKAVVGTPEGLLFLAVGNVVGAVLSLVVFTLTVVSFPLMLDRDIDFITAMITSVRAVLLNPVVMLGWAAIVVLLLVAGVASGFLGLIVALPVLGHATWHLYRRVVAPDL
jgi:uncharacterized membrane protein